MGRQMMLDLEGQEASTALEQSRILREGQEWSISTETLLAIENALT